MKKLSDLKPEPFFDLLEEILPALNVAFESENIKTIIVGYQKDVMSQTDANMSVIKGYLEIVTLIAKNYRESAYKILAILNDVEVEEVKEKFTPQKITSQLVAMLRDEDFASFLSYVEPSEQKE